MQQFPPAILDAIDAAHVSWRPTLMQGIEAVAKADPSYFPSLLAEHYLPTEGRLFAAFAQPMSAVRYVLVGEGPYPRAQSATGFSFMDGAVGQLWSDAPGGGLSKLVNRATSLRNFIKMLLVADGRLAADHTTGDALALIALQARAIASPLIQTLADLQDKLMQQGFLLLNAALVFRPHVAPVKDARAWRPFIELVLDALMRQAVTQGDALPTLVLWGKIAEQLNGMAQIGCFPKVVSEHPYNLSFIANAEMQHLFGAMQLLHK